MQMPKPQLDGLGQMMHLRPAVLPLLRIGPLWSDDQLLLQSQSNRLGSARNAQLGKYTTDVELDR
jgi:hypothetical protein